MGAFSLDNLLCDAGEHFWVLLREGSEDLSVEHHTLLLKLCYEGAVRFVAVVAYGGVQAHNPKLTELILLIAAVGKCLLSGVYERLLSGTLLLRATMAVSLSTLKHIAAALCTDDSSFYSWHRLVLKCLGSWKEAAANTCPKLQGLGTLLRPLGAATLLGVEVVLSGLAYDKLPLAGNSDAL